MSVSKVSIEQLPNGAYVVVKKKKPTKHALAALQEFEEAAVDLGFIGNSHPDDHEEIEERYKKAKARLIKHLAK